MERLSKYKYAVDLPNGADLDATDAYFIIQFESTGKIYVGWTGRTKKTVRQKLHSLINQAFSNNASWLLSYNPDMHKAFTDSKYISVDTIELSNEFTNQLDAVYEGLYALIDKYECYNPYGYNIICASNKSDHEKKVIERFAPKWNIPISTFTADNKSFGRIYAAKPLYEYKKVSSKLFVFYKKWDSVKDYINSMKPYKITPSAIYMCCNGQRNTAYGSTWRFRDNGETIQL